MSTRRSGRSELGARPFLVPGPAAQSKVGLCLYRELSLRLWHYRELILPLTVLLGPAVQSDGSPIAVQSEGCADHRNVIPFAYSSFPLICPGHISGSGLQWLQTRTYKWAGHISGNLDFCGTPQKFRACGAKMLPIIPFGRSPSSKTTPTRTHKWKSGATSPPLNQDI